MSQLLMSTFILCLLLLIPCTAAFAYHETYSPFVSATTPCEIKNVQMTQENDLLKQFQYAGFQINIHYEASRFVELISNNKPLLTKIPVTGSRLALHSVITADLSQDNQPDFIITHGSGGNGFAGGDAWRIIFLSSPSGYAAWEFDTYDPNNNDLIFIKNTGCILVQNTPMYVDKANDQKGHYFWVYNLVSFAQPTPSYNNNLLSSFPKWIQYTYKPNHWETKLLSKEQKQALWQTQESQIRLLHAVDQTD